MLPKVLCVPCGSGRIPFETARAEDIVLCLYGPAADIGIFKASGIGTNRAKTLDVIEERDRALGEIGHFGRPVVHLYIDVGMVVTAPRRVVRVIPEALQVRGKTSGTRRRNHEVTSELKEQGFEPGIGRAIA